MNISKNRTVTAKACALASIAALMLFMGEGGLAVVSGASSFNAVQVFVQTGTSLPYSYSVSAYNSTGNLAVSYQSNFPAAAFELPTGTYLFVVSAYYQHYAYCGTSYPCPLAVSEGSGGVSGVTTSVNTQGNPTSLPPLKNGTGNPIPIRYEAPESEYGYEVLDVSGPATITIQTQNVTKIPTIDVTIKTTFVNGTAASGTSVSAYVVGQWYYWWGYGNGTSMYGQTGPDGTVKLTVPQVPVETSAWLWIPVSLPENQTSGKVNVGGQPVNVTGYWQPTYAGFAGSALVIPPATGATITLQEQQQNFWVMPSGTTYGSIGAPVTAGGTSYSAGVTVANAPGGVPSSVADQRSASASGTNQGPFSPSSQISPLSGTNFLGSTPSAGGIPGLIVAVVLVAGVGAVVALLAFVAIRRKK